jgi:hypothetical protein
VGVLEESVQQQHEGAAIAPFEEMQTQTVREDGA